MFKMLKNQKGMTLVELLAVMVIVGIIAAISIPAIGGLIENSRKDAAVSAATSLVEAARMYVAAEGKSNGDSVMLTAGTATTDADKKKDLVELGYLDAAPKDPSNKQAYPIATVNVVIDSSGKATYTVTLGGQKYNIPATNASELNRTKVSVS